MCVKLPPRDINSGHCPPYLISTYTCEVTIIPRYAMMSMNLTIGRFVHFISTYTCEVTITLRVYDDVDEFDYRKVCTCISICVPCNYHPKYQYTGL